MFVDSDDILGQNAIEKLMRKAIATDADIVAGNYISISFNGKTRFKGSDYKEEKVSPCDYLYGQPWGKVYKHEFFQNLRFPEGYWYEDSIFAQIMWPLVDNVYTIPDIVYKYRNNLKGISHKVEAKKKIVFVHNDYKGMEYPEIYEKKYFAEMDVIATISDTCADILCQVFPECCNKICSIPNLVSSDAIRQYAILEEPEEFVHESCIKLLSVGRLTEQKGFDMAIEAASLLKKHNRNFKWIIIGNGEKEEDLKKLALKKNVEDCMLFIGLKDNPYIYMKCADIIVQTSRWEGKSVVLDEAKIIGTPIVTTDYPTAKDQIKDGKEGILVEMTPNGIASGIERLIDNVALKENIHKYLISHEYGNSKEIGRYYSMFDN